MRDNQGFISAFAKASYLTAVILVISGCGTGAPLAPTAAATSSIPTSTPTLTSTPTQTFTPRPTATFTPTIVPTPASIGAAVPYGSLEITLIRVATHDLIVPGGYSYYYPTDRTNFFLDLGVLVKNQDTAHTDRVRWNDVFITEANGKTSSPAFADMKVVEPGTKYDPFKIGIATQISSTDSVEFAKDTYLRLIFVVGRKQTIIFRIQDSPTISFTVP